MTLLPRQFAQVLPHRCSCLFLALLRYVLLPTVMNTDKLYGAGAIYLMLGIMWMYFYGIIQYFYPGAFSAGGARLSSMYSTAER